MGNQNFFSIVVPAHNEEKYISRTLKHLLSVSYPKDRYEAIIVENGSSDKTYRIAKKFSSKNIKVYSLKTPGVSRARNFGSSKISKKSDWIIFLDADTLLKRKFLIQLNEFLSREKNKDVVSAATSVMPVEKSLKSRIILRIYSVLLNLSKASYAISMAKTKFFKKVKFDENLKVTEDMKFLRDISKFGRFAFLYTDQVETSTRRFEKMGWFKVFYTWAKANLIPANLKKFQNYEVIR